MMMPAVLNVLAIKGLYNGTMLLPSSFLIISSIGWKNIVESFVIPCPKPPAEFACNQFPKYLNHACFEAIPVHRCYFIYVTCGAGCSLMLGFGRFLNLIQGKCTVNCVILEVGPICMLFRSISLTQEEERNRWLL